MMNGLYVKTKEEHIEKYSQSSADLTLIGKGGGVEVMIQKIAKGSNAFVEPGDIPDSMEFFYILDGGLEITNGDKKRELTKKDYFYTNHLEDTVHFTTLYDTTLLYLSSEPVFQYLSTTLKELQEIRLQLEEKDLYTKGHSDRVKDLSLLIAEELRLSKEQLENITQAALFHDIGKINIPDDILLKQAALTEEEFEVMKQHPLMGVKLVERTYYKSISDIIAQHHERLDGTGYPQGLTEDEICLEAKIIAVADTFDAITTDRPYRKGLSAKYALEELKKYTGIHYDKRVVKTLQKVLKTNGTVE